MPEASYRFSRRVDNYIKYRPRYPPAILDLLRAECRLTDAHVIADIGSGTGLLTELFLKNGNRVYGIEPDPDMRAGGEDYLRAYPRFTSIAATAEATTLPDHSKEKVFENPLVCDWEGLKGRVLSNGPALEPGDLHYPAMLAALAEIFRAHQDNGTVTIEHDTRMIYGHLQVER